MMIRLTSAERTAWRARVNARMRPVGGMNKLEAAYALWLEAQKRAGRLQWWAYEPLSLRLAKGASYCPDFVLLMADGSIEAHETKGHWREAARVRIKVAARAFPWMKFIAVKKAPSKIGGMSNGWETEEIGA